MTAPALLMLPDEAAYQAEYECQLCLGVVTTHDGIRVYFERHAFGHAFYVTPMGGGTKGALCPDRSQRLTWIAPTLQTANADLYQGYDSKKKVYVPNRRVAVMWDNFVVVTQLTQRKDGALKGKFVTCYKADNSIGKIRTSPAWDEAACRAVLAK